MATQYTAGLTTGQVLTAATMNSIGAAWETFNPTWASSGTAPAIGNGTIAGRYCQIQKLIVFQFRIQFGSTTTFGTGSYNFTLPKNYKTGDTFIGSVNALDASAGYLSYGLSGITVSTNKFQLYYVAAGGLVGQTTPITWQQTDIIGGTLVYEEA